MLLEYVRLSLFEREGLDLDWRRKSDGAPFESREAWIRDVFSREISFLYRKGPRIYVPEPDIPKGERFIAGRVGRPTVSIENDREASLHETTREVWRAALLFIDPQDHADGQKIAFEIDGEIGKALPVLEALADAINNRLPSERYLVEVHGITDPQTFWQYVEENQGQITNITFEVAAPNMFRSVDDFSEEMKELRDTEKVQTAKIELANPDGLNPQTQRIKDAVNYTVKGGGAIKARAKGKKPYNSRNKTRKINVPKPKPDAKRPLSDFIKEILQKVFGLS